MISGISDRARLAQLRSDGMHVRTADLRCRFLIEDDDVGSTGPQVAYSISRKVGNAVVRNRTRRRLRAVFAELLGSSDAPHFTAAMVIVLPGAQDRSYDALRNQVMDLMKKIEKSTDTPS